jgi:hypothetical protein
MSRCPRPFRWVCQLLSPPAVLADADGDAAVAAGTASAIPAASAPVTFDFMVLPEWLVLLTIAERRTRRTREKYWPGYWPAGGVDPWPASGYHMAPGKPAESTDGPRRGPIGRIIAGSLATGLLGALVSTLAAACCPGGTVAGRGSSKGRKGGPLWPLGEYRA